MTQTHFNDPHSIDDMTGDPNATDLPDFDDLPVEDHQTDTHRNSPRPDLACLYGLVGEVARAGGATTEANQFAIALNLIAYLGAAVGRGPYMQLGNTWHHCRNFTLHIGRTGRGRKGDAASLVHRIDKAVRAIDKSIAPQVHAGGLSTREGLVMFIHDGYKNGNTDIEPIHDKRLWVVESEFSNILQQSKRDGNTLSSALRDCWDGVSIQPATKSNRVGATDPHVALSGAVTPSELRSLMANRELTNGFANRFLMIFAERTKLVPYPQPTPQHVVDDLAEKVVQVLRFAGADRPFACDTKLMELTPSARTLYGDLYLGELNDQSFGATVAALMERQAPTLRRLAMLFAICDLTDQIDVPHIKAALAWIRFWVESVKYVFATADDEFRVKKINDASMRIVQFLRLKGRVTRTELSRDCFAGHLPKAELDAALDELLASTPPKIEVRTVVRPKNNPGAATTSYVLTANCANSAKCGAASVSPSEVDQCEVREVREMLSRSDEQSSQTRKVRSNQNPPATSVSTEPSHNSHISPPAAEDTDHAVTEPEDAEVI